MAAPLVSAVLWSLAAGTSKALRQGFLELDGELDADCALARRDVELCEERRSKLGNLFAGKWHDPGDELSRPEPGIRRYGTRHRAAEDSSVGAVGAEQREVEVQRAAEEDGDAITREQHGVRASAGFSDAEAQASKRAGRK